MHQDNTTKLVERLVELMERMSVRMRSRSPVEWSGLVLTMAQARTLYFLGSGPKRMTEISGYLGRGMPAATSMIDRLVKKGRVERTEDPSDRRVVTCQLTPIGREVVEKFLRIGRMRERAIAEVLTLEELEAVVPAMVILSEALERVDEAAPAESHDGNAGGERSGRKSMAARHR